MNEAKITALKEEIESIHFADALYWKRGRHNSREASAEYQRRQDRLPEIRSKLALLDIPMKRGGSRRSSSNSGRFTFAQLLVCLRRVHLVVRAIEQSAQSLALRPFRNTNAQV
jgi:hypothetical protein